MKRAFGFVVALVAIWGSEVRVVADEPTATYIFPPGARRGSAVDVQVGGCYLHEACDLLLNSDGILTPRQLLRGQKNVWFEGPRIPLPASQRKEDYPWPQEGRFSVREDATLGQHWWRVRTAQGITAALPFVVGDLPEVVENEIDGRPVPQHVRTPVTINGRIFPREDVDIWTFDGEAGATYVCEVVAERIGSALNSRIQVTSVDGQVFDERVDAGAIGNDSRVIFTANRSGKFSVRIHDANFGGLQNYVYRLTITERQHPICVYPLGGRRGVTNRFHIFGENLSAESQVQEIRFAEDVEEVPITVAGSNALPIWVEATDWVELSESLDGIRRPTLNASSILNGRISEPAERDEWRIQATQGQTWRFEVRAASLGSGLDSLIYIRDVEGRILAENDDADEAGDSGLQWTAPADGEFTLDIGDVFDNRGGRGFAYRVECELLDAGGATREESYPFDLILESDTVAAPIGGVVELGIKVVSRGKFKEPIRLQVAGLPPGVRYEPIELGLNTKKAKLVFSVDRDADLIVSELQVWGVVTVAEGRRQQVVKHLPPIEAPLQVRRLARVESSLRRGVPTTSLTLATTIATPFLYEGQFETKYAACGSSFSRSFQVQRNGFEGLIRARLAERQTRHLQGVTGEEVTIPAGEDSFRFTIRLAPWMEVGRTSRTCLMLTGRVPDRNGKLHTVSYTSFAQNDQIIVLVDPPLLAIEPLVKSVIPNPGMSAQVPFRVTRGNGVVGPVRVTLRVPAHLAGVHSKPVVVPAGVDHDELEIYFGDSLGPINTGATLRAETVNTPRLIAEAAIDF